MLSISGSLKVKGEEQQVSEKFKKREFVITDNSSQYPQHITFQLTQDKCSLLNNYNIGDMITVFFNLRGREWTDREGKVKYFNSLEAWKIDGQQQTAPAAATASSFNEPQVSSFNSNEDDLPF